ncbi:MAG: leucine-rich repeat protein [Tenericutes bacterium]|jgi:hypothetical protein|nr:leucine-rich repeat protein [Mycoplasmatota bacterium]
MKYKSILTIVFLAIIIFLNGCSNTSERHTLLLMNEDGTVYQEMADLYSQEVELPVLEEEDRIFVGWNDGDSNHYFTYVIESDTTLTAKFENIEEVFNINFIGELDDQANILNYSGEAIYLKIPAEINGHRIKSIYMNAFTGSTVEVIEIPISITYIQPFAFEDADALRDVSFYGTPSGTTVKVYSSSELDELLEEYGDACEVASTSNQGNDIVYSEGCPIISSSLSNSVILEGVEYFTYLVVLDLEFIPEAYHQVIYNYAFKDADSLESIELPPGIQYITGRLFENTPNLKEITVDPRNEYLTSENGILFSKDKSILYLYPSGIEDTTYTIPDYVTRVIGNAFIRNNYLEELYIHENLQYDPGSFSGMLKLENFFVAEENDELTTIDGVLFSKTDDILIAYPNGRSQTSYALPESTNQVDYRAFAYNEVLTNLILNDGLKVIALEAFYSITSLQVLDIPSSIQEIGHNIVGESQVKSVIIRRSINDGDLPDMQFQLLNRARTEEDPFVYVEQPNIYVPDDSVEAYLIEFRSNYWIDYLKPLSEYNEESD